MCHRMTAGRPIVRFILVLMITTLLIVVWRQSWTTSTIDWYTAYLNTSARFPDKCTTRDVSLSAVPLVYTGLVSFPGSGNTWIRHLIQQMTGIGTSSVYCDISLRRKGFPFECTGDKNKTVVVKTHRPTDVEKFKKVVFIIRNPYDALLAFLNFKAAGHVGKASMDRLVKQWNDTFDESRLWYIHLVEKVCMFPGPVHVLQYDRLKGSLHKDLRALATFLEVPVTEHDIRCTMKEQEGLHHRNKTKNKQDIMRKLYDKKKRRILEQVVNDTETMLSKRFPNEIFDLEKEF